MTLKTLKFLTGCIGMATYPAFSMVAGSSLVQGQVWQFAFFSMAAAVAGLFSHALAADLLLRISGQD